MLLTDDTVHDAVLQRGGSWAHLWLGIVGKTAEVTGKTLRFWVCFENSSAKFACQVLRTGTSKH